MADLPEPTRLPHRDTVVARVEEMVRSGSAPAVFAVEVAGFDALAGSAPDDAHRALREVESRLDSVVRGRDVLGFEPPARFLLGCSALEPDRAGGLVDRIRSGAAFPVDIGGEPISLLVDVGAAYFSVGATGASLVDDAESDLRRISG